VTEISVSGVSARSPAATIGGWLRRNLYTLLGLSISVIALWQLVAQVDPATVVQVVLASNWGLVALCVASIPLSMALKAIRWRYLFLDREAVKFEALFSALYVGYLVNTVLPGRVGEFVRAFLIGQQGTVGTPAALATIVLEKMLDLVALAVLLAIVLQQMPLPEALQLGANSFLLLLGAGLIGLAVVVAAPGTVLRLVDWLVGLVPLFQRLGLGQLAHSFVGAFAVLRRTSTLPGLLFWSVMVWVGAIVTMWTGLASVGVQVGLPVVLLVLVATSIGMTAPSAPGYVGVFHFIMVQSLLPFGVPVELATGAAFLVHIVIFGNFVICGVWFVWRSGYSLNRLRQASSH
jgi:uncharacterized protein (TIRG00374 family)